MQGCDVLEYASLILNRTSQTWSTGLTRSQIQMGSNHWDLWSLLLIYPSLGSFCLNLKVSCFLCLSYPPRVVVTLGILVGSEILPEKESPNWKYINKCLSLHCNSVFHEIKLFSWVVPLWGFILSHESVETFILCFGTSWRVSLRSIPTWGWYLAGLCQLVPKPKMDHEFHSALPMVLLFPISFLIPQSNLTTHPNPSLKPHQSYILSVIPIRPPPSPIIEPNCNPHLIIHLHLLSILIPP